MTKLIAAPEVNMVAPYVEGARFLHPQQEVDEDAWPRSPQNYRPTTLARQRFNDLGDLIDGDIIEDALRYGEIYAAERGAVAFVNEQEGVAFYIIVNKEEHDDVTDYLIVSIWPYVYNRSKALDSGRWLPNELNKIQSVIPQDPEDEFDELD